MGDVLLSLKTLRECIAAGDAWQKIYDETADRIRIAAVRLDQYRLPTEVHLPSEDIYLRGSHSTQCRMARLQVTL